MKVAVTGAAGFIGSAVCGALLARGDEVVAVDDLSGWPGEGELARVAAAGAQVVRADAAIAPDRWLDGAQALIHLAGLPGVRSAAPLATLWQSNVATTEAVLGAAERAGVRMVHASTSSVYGDAVARPTPEDAPYAPRNPYAAGKVAAEQACLGATRRGADVVIARFFTVYGPGQRPDMAFARWIDALAANRPAPVCAPCDARRDFTYVKIAVAGLLAALDRGRPGEAYNLGSGDSVDVRAALEIVAGAVGRPAHSLASQSSVAEVVATHACTTKARRELGHSARTPLVEGAAQQAQAILSNRPSRSSPMHRIAIALSLAAFIAPGCGDEERGSVTAIGATTTGGASTTATSTGGATTTPTTTGATAATVDVSETDFALDPADRGSPSRGSSSSR